MTNTFLSDLQSEHPDLEAALKVLKLGDENGVDVQENQLPTEEGGQRIATPEAMVTQSSPHADHGSRIDSDLGRVFLPRDTVGSDDPNSIPQFDPAWSMLNWDTFPDFMDTMSGDQFGVSGGYWNINPSDMDMDMLQDPMLPQNFT